MKYYVHCILFLLFVTGCTAVEGDFEGRLVEEFPGPVELEGREILDQKMGILYAELVDTLMICVTQNAPFFHVYDKQQNHITSFAQKGRGPGEFTIPPLIRDVIFEKNSVKLLTDDQITRELLTINITSSIKEEQLVVEKRVPYPEKSWALRNIFLVNDESYIGIYDNRPQEREKGKAGGFYYDSQSDSLSFFPLLNVAVEPFENRAAMGVNTRFAGLSLDQNKIVSVMVRFPAMELLNIGATSNGGAITSSKRLLLDPDPPDITFDLRDYKDDRTTDYYQYLQVTDQYIYLLYSGHKENEPQKEQIIRVMDWDGNPIAQYLIPEEYDLSTFDVDEEDKTFYGSSYNNDAIYVFNYE